MATEPTVTDAEDDGWPSRAERAGAVEQAKALREQAQEGGLRFCAYLPPGLAEWLLGLIERGIFSSPSEAVFVILGEHQDLEPHHDLRRELLTRTIQAAMDDPRPGIPSEEVFRLLREKAAEPLPEPAVWAKLPGK